MDIKSILDPKARHIFFAKDALTYAFPIVHVDDELLYFTSHQNISQEKFDQGHFLAPENAGIVLFKNPITESVPSRITTDGTMQLFRLDFKNQKYEITNRRQTPRHEFRKFVPMNFNVFGEIMAAQLLNISEGGLKMCVETPLKKNILCHLEITLPRIQDDEPSKSFGTNGLIMYSDRDENTGKYLIGISFVSPDFVSLEQKQKYINAKATLATFIQQQFENRSSHDDVEDDDLTVS